MIGIRNRAARVATALFTLVTPLFTTSSPAVAVGTTRYVAATGSVGAGTSCASPGYVGATHASIQAAMNAASSGDTVYVCAGTYAISTRLEVTKTLTLKGAGAPATILDGGGTTQILIVQDASIDDNVSGDEITATVEDMSFVNGYATDINGTECGDGNRCGGAIFVENESRINITGVHFKNNKADFIGGAFARFLSASQYPTVNSSISRSSFESNQAKLDGGAVATLFGFGLSISESTFYQNGLLPTWDARSGAAVIANFADATINNSTIVDHDAPAGITVLYGDITLNRTLVAQTAGSTTVICNGQQTVGGSRGNLVTDGSCSGATQSKAAAGAGNSARVTYADLKLGTFSYRGYGTKSIPLLASSAALDHATGCILDDQVGTTVPQGSGCDVGAIERPSTQTLNTVDTSGWSYGSSTLYRSNGANVALVTAPTDAAARGVTYSSKTSGVCTVNSTTGALTLVADGTCTLTASSPGYLLRDETSADKSWTVSATAPATTTTTTTTVVATTTTTTSVVPSSTSTTVAAGAIAPVSATTTTTATVDDSADSDAGAAESRRTTTAPAAVSSTSTTVAPTTTTTMVPAPDAPGAEPGAAAVVVDGESVDATLERLDNSYVVSGAGVNVTVSGVSADGARIPLDPDGTLRLEPGDSVVVDATGYASGSDVEAWMFSVPSRLGTMAADATGKASATFVVPASIEAGNHRLVLTGANSNGSEVVLSMGIALGAYESGSSVQTWVIVVPIAAAVIVAVVIPTTVRRRRKIRLGA